jgi:hypothetical protein
LEDVRIEKGAFYRRFRWGWRRCRPESYFNAEAGAARTRQESGEAGAAEEAAEWTFDTSRIARTSPQHTSGNAYLSEPECNVAELPADACRTQ